LSYSTTRRPTQFGIIPCPPYCWFTDLSRALCLKLAQTPNTKKPLIGMCDSTRCPQATHHACHRPVWAEHQTTTKVFLGNLGRGHRAERERLEADLARCEHVSPKSTAPPETEPDMGRITDQDRQHNETAIRAAMDRLLAGGLPRVPA
jgi:hypothetical protein